MNKKREQITETLQDEHGAFYAIDEWEVLSIPNELPLPVLGAIVFVVSLILNQF